MNRKRRYYFFLVILTIMLGLGSRKFPELLPSFLFLYLGDTLWAIMVFFILGFLWPRVSTFLMGVLSLGFCYGIELTQFYHASWIDQIRQTTLGGLILGMGFLWSDLLCYTIGIILGIGIEFYFHQLTVDDSQ